MIREMAAKDLAGVAALAQQRRETYARYEPQFWRVAEGAVEAHTAYLRATLEGGDAVLLVASDGSEIAGFAICRLVPAPPVYDPGGPSGFIDDFVVASDTSWTTVGRELLTRAAAELRARGAAQVVVVCGHRDEAKRSALTTSGLSLASEWYVGSLDKAPGDASA